MTEQTEVMGAKDVAEKIKQIIEDCWARTITDEEAKRDIENILDVREYRMKVFRGNEKTAVFERTMGIRRLKKFDELIK
jgi:hypothetical protein